MTEERKAITAVIPLHLGNYRDQRDPQRVCILLKSLNVFDPENVIDEIIFILNDRNDTICSNIRNHEGDKKLTFIHELDVAPVLDSLRTLHGWKKQQILKLAAHSVVRTDFYLTLDADIICSKLLTYEAFVQDKKGLVQKDKKFGLGSYFNRLVWWFASAQVLRTTPKFSEEGVAVTPFLFSTEACRHTVRYLGELNESTSDNWTEVLFHHHNRSDQTDNVGSLNWTEYSLYFLSLQKLGMFDQYHFFGDSRSSKHCELLSKNSFGFIHSPRNFENWSASCCFSVRDPALFFAVQSRSEVDPEKIKKKIEPHFHA